MIVQKLIRNLRESSKKCDLKIGDHVVMINCLEAETNPGKIWTVTSGPWEICGTICVKLEGKTGGFDASCLRKIIPAQSGGMPGA